MADGEAEELVGNRVCLDVIEGRHEEVEVGEISVLNTEIVDDEDKGYGTGEVTEQASGGRLDKAKLKQKGDEAALT